ncbi:GNAT family N-acetyltransferase [Streptomyces gamaensis]|uniref:GNAT family N-acetyltransferase n=1 Tax=Streptomyces gamaensis TaxID=1763542 RepID=A0ABW0Z177_9ACTN
MTSAPIRTAVVPVAEIFGLRHPVLRPGLPAEAAVYPEDGDPRTFHVAAYDGAGAVRACVTFFPDPFPHPAPGTDAAWRFRGMGSHPDVRGLGYGAAVLRAGLAEAAARGAGLVWCNGRTSARGFYERLGFTATGEEFVLAPSGPHHVFSLPLPHPRGRGDGTVGGPP